MQKLYPIINETEDEQLKTAAKLLDERIAYPESFVTLLGETSAGKTSLINGMFGQEVLPVSSRPTTGTVIELYEDDYENDITAYALLKNAKLRPLTMQEFQVQSKHPGRDVDRLRLSIPRMPHNLTGMRLFDTPGYDSIHDTHENVLKEFIPNSDVIIYVVNYRVGIGESDALFLEYVKDHLHEHIKFFLVVNRVPSGITKQDKRIREIVGYGQDLLHQNIEPFLVESISGDGQKLPQANELWKATSQEIQSSERVAQLKWVLQGYQNQLLDQAEIHWRKKKARFEASEEEMMFVEEKISELNEKKVLARNMIHETFSTIEVQLPKYFQHIEKQSVIEVEKEVKQVNKWTSAEECIAFVNHHYLKRQIKMGADEINDYIQRELTHLNDRLDELINQAIVEFETDIKAASDRFAPVVDSVARSVANKVADNAVKTLLASYGGRGGAGAGVANLAKKGLKNVGKVFGKTFSRDTHNALAKFLSKIGATSTRNISIAITIGIEGLIYVIEANRWQGKLIKGVEKSVDQWKSETNQMVIKDLKELQEQNLDTLNSQFDAFLSIIEEDDNQQYDETLIHKINQQLQEIEKLRTVMQKEGIAQ